VLLAAAREAGVPRFVAQSFAARVLRVSRCGTPPLSWNPAAETGGRALRPTKNEIELVRFIREGSFDWAIYERAAETTRSGRLRPSSDEQLRPRR
jgi:hypothetical protein